MRNLVTAALILLAGFLSGQDIHFSQFYNSGINLTPAKTGIFRGDQRITAGHRGQWRSVPVPWTTYTLAYDRKFIPKYDEAESAFFSGGFLVNYDEASNLSDLTLSNINLTGSYTKILDERNLLSLGLLLGYAGRGFDESTLTWDKQWNETEFFFDSRLNSTEDFDADRINFLETGLGLNFRWQADSLTNFELGLGIFHLTTPEVGFYDNDDIQLSARYTLSAICNFNISQLMGIQVHSLAQFQGPYREYVIGALGKFNVSEEWGKRFQLHIGFGYRTTEALFPTIAIRYNNLYGSISYDLDLTDFGDGKDARLNALEIHFQYRIFNPKRMKGICPVY